MPHKKAKRSVREGQRKLQGSDLAPDKDSIGNETIPKSVSRVLNAFQIREDYKKKRKLEQDGGDEKSAKRRRKTDDFELKIKPGESIQHFYRRVEDDLRPVVRSAVQTSKAVERKARKSMLESKKNVASGPISKTTKSNARHAPRGQSPPPPSGPDRKAPIRDKDHEQPKEFEILSTSAPRRLNDIAQAPPEIKKTPRGVRHTGSGAKREGVLSMAQKSMMEQEREKAIARYRLLKASRLLPMENQ
ncbi:hypothetical protein AN958_11744 [Leucoagaricus sp. SymC.cos]|nr:hypothetical protein AN958_11744 [Leucoagaricus sp. SymC.cos]